MKNFSEKIKKLLKSQKMTKGELCQKVGITLNGIKHMEDNNKVKIETLEKISEVLGVTTAYFLNDVDSPDTVYGILSVNSSSEESYKDKLIESLSSEKLQYQKQLFRALEFIKSQGLNFHSVSRRASCWKSNFFLPIYQQFY